MIITCEKSTVFPFASVSLPSSSVKNLRFWLKGENLLAQRYEINAGYPMPKATFMGGVNFKF